MLADGTFCDAFADANVHKATVMIMGMIVNKIRESGERVAKEWRKSGERVARKWRESRYLTVFDVDQGPITSPFGGLQMDVVANRLTQQRSPKR